MCLAVVCMEDGFSQIQSQLRSKGICDTVHSVYHVSLQKMLNTILILKENSKYNKCKF